jgi:hypothetical protein
MQKSFGEFEKTNLRDSARSQLCGALLHVLGSGVSYPKMMWKLQIHVLCRGQWGIRPVINPIMGPIIDD